MKQLNLNFSKAIELFLLLLVFIQIIYFNITDKLKLLINPRYNGFVIFSSIILLIFISFLYINLLTNKKNHNKIADSKYVLLFIIIVLMNMPSYSKFQNKVSELKGANIGNTTVYSDNSDKLIENEESISKNLIVESNSNIGKIKTISDSEIVVNSNNFISLLDKIYKEPHKFKDKSISIKGFVYKVKAIDKKYFIISRMSMICCAADASIIGIFCESKNNSSSFKQNDWYKIEGKITVKKIKLQEKELPVINISKYEKIKKFDNPYVYPTFN